MSGLEKETIGGFNSLVEKQKDEPGEANITTVLFDSKYELLHDRVDLKDVIPSYGKSSLLRTQIWTSWSKLERRTGKGQ